MVSESWFRSLWRIPRRHEAGPEKVPIGVLAFEAASLMSKIVHLWQSLSDKHIARLREEIKNSVGIKKLVSDDDDFITHLICAELMENMRHVAKSVARLAKKCSDPGLMSFEHAFDVYILIGADPCGWLCTWKKMEKKVKKMEHFMSVNAKLYQEMEIMADFEQTLRTMRANHVELESLLEYEKKAAWKRQEVKSLREMSLWNRTYDYAIRLMVRSLFTIFGRIKYVFGINQFVGGGESDGGIDSDFIYRSQSVSALLHSSVHPSEDGISRYSSDGITRFASGPLGNFTPKSGPLLNTKKPNYFQSGPLGGGSTAKSGPLGGGSTAKSGPIGGKNRNLNFFSGPLGKPSINPISEIKKTSKKLWASRIKSTSKKPHLAAANGITQGGPFNGCKMTASSPVNNCYVSAKDVHSGNLDRVKDSTVSHLSLGNALADDSSSIFNSNRRMLDAPPETLGAVALALHYANVIIVIEKLVASPHLIGHDAREDLYNMLPARVRSALRERLKPYAKSLASSVYDPELAGEWTEAMTLILEWLAPLAHNMIRWQSERSFEQQSLLSRTNVLLVQTLFFANQEKTEATITELLVGLNYVYIFGRDQTVKVLQEGASSRIFNGCLTLDK